jgi:hypothetical protein
LGPPVPIEWSHPVTIVYLLTTIAGTVALGTFWLWTPRFLSMRRTRQWVIAATACCVVAAFWCLETVTHLNVVYSHHG